MYGFLGGFTGAVEWTIPDFFSQDVRYIESPMLLLEGCTWRLVVYPKGRRNGWVSAYLRKHDTIIAHKKVTVSIGIKFEEGIVAERTTICSRTFRKGQLMIGWTEFWKLDDLLKRFELAPLGAVTFTCRFHHKAPTLKEVVANSEKVESQQTALVALEGLSSDFKDLLSREKTCDFTVNVQGKEFRTHRAVLSARSPTFCAMLEHDTTEAKTGVLNIPDCDPESFNEFLNFLYSGKIEEVSFDTAYHLYSTAEKYDVQELKSFCANYLKQNMSTDTVCKVVILSDQFCDHPLYSSAQNFFNNNFLKIFLTSDWKAILKNSPRLADKLLSEMSTASLNNYF